jgi:hypothetical protein
LTKNRLLNKLRTHDYYKPMLKALADCGIVDYEILKPTGVGHPILKFFAHGGVHRIPLPGTPRGGAAIRYIPVEIRSRVRGDIK